MQATLLKYISGSLSSGRRSDSGITLVELLVGLTIIAVILAIAWPNLTTGIDGIRLRTTVDNIAVFFTEARNVSDRLQTPVQITVLPKEDQLHAVTIDGDWRNVYELPDRIHIIVPRETGAVILFPGAPTPELRLLLEAEHGPQTGLRFNIFTGVAEKWEPDEPVPAI
ncbi:MAG: prepilin-type N-terminal cleavage/methylation domain-containing protein [Bryobacterales bacterium]|nr:prepilin-type N-terminal cleavage/methylation domain-containing protein [Bryobacterales bacterium]